MQTLSTAARTNGRVIPRSKKGTIIRRNTDAQRRSSTRTDTRLMARSSGGQTRTAEKGILITSRCISRDTRTKHTNNTPHTTMFGRSIAHSTGSMSIIPGAHVEANTATAFRKTASARNLAVDIGFAFTAPR